MNVLIVSAKKGTGNAVYCKLKAITEITSFIVTQPGNWDFCKEHPIDLLVWDGDCKKGLLVELQEYFPKSNIVTIDDSETIDEFPFENILKLMKTVKRSACLLFTNY